MALIENIVRTIADVEGVDPSNLPSVGDSVDLDALENLVKSDGFIEATVEHAGYHIRIESDGTVKIL